MFHRFKLAVEIAQYINTEIVNVLNFGRPPADAVERTVGRIIASFETQAKFDTYGMAEFEDMLIDGVRPLDTDKWIRDLYVEFDRTRPEHQAQYLEENGNPNDKLYQAISSYYSKRNPSEDSAEKLRHLKDPVVIPEPVVVIGKLHQLVKTQCEDFADVWFVVDTIDGEPCFGLRGDIARVQQVIALTTLALYKEAINTVTDSFHAMDSQIALLARHTAHNNADRLAKQLLTEGQFDSMQSSTFVYWCDVE